MFNVGQKVVCVDADNTRCDGLKELHKGAIYTVAALDIENCCPYPGPSDRFVSLPGMHVAEVQRQACNLCGGRQPFARIRFRPITERKTDISELKKLCEPTPAKSVEVVR